MMVELVALRSPLANCQGPEKMALMFDIRPEFNNWKAKSWAVMKTCISLHDKL